MASQKKRRKARRKAKQRSHAHNEKAVQPERSVQFQPTRSNAEYIFNLCKTRPDRYSKTRPIQRMTGTREWRGDKYVGKNDAHRARTTYRWSKSTPVVVETPTETTEHFFTVEQVTYE